MDPLKENITGSGFIISRNQRVVNLKDPQYFNTGKKSKIETRRTFKILVFSLRICVLSLARI